MRRLAAGVAIAATALLAAAALGAFTSADPSAAPAPDGIAVKGDWKVTIKDPDGSVVRVHRFENAFDGASTAAGILSHGRSTGRYWLTLSSTGGSNPCGTEAPQSCFVFEPDDPNATVAGWFGNLAVSNNGGQLVVTGEIEATRDGDFNHVRMLLSHCVSTTPSSTCTPGAYGAFSTRTLPSPIALVTGQQAIVTVTYSFSAA